MTSCGVHSATILNSNINSTNVELSKKNFVVLERVSGSSSATYILGIGGLYNRALVERAKAKMLKNADITGGSKAIINLTTEDHFGGLPPIFFQKTVTVSGHIIQFTE